MSVYTCTYIYRDYLMGSTKVLTGSMSFFGLPQILTVAHMPRISESCYAGSADVQRGVTC